MLLTGEQPMTSKEAQLCSPLRLAYIGDTIWDLLVRSRLMFKGYNLHHMHEDAVRSVNAQAQATAFGRIESSLTEDEETIAKRGRNAHARHPSPKHQSPSDYQYATALETLFGYLYLTGQEERIRELFSIASGMEENYAGCTDEM